MAAITRDQLEAAQNRIAIAFGDLPWFQGVGQGKERAILVVNVRVTPPGVHERIREFAGEVPFKVREIGAVRAGADRPAPSDARSREVEERRERLAREYELLQRANIKRHTLP